MKTIMEAKKMSFYKYVRDAFKNRDREIWFKRLVDWRAEPATIRIAKPTRLDRARSVGYKAKPGFILVRQRVDRGGRQKPDIKGARRSKRMSQRMNLDMNYQHVAELRAARKFPNLEVLNSYYVAEDGTHNWFEIVMIDPEHPAILSDKTVGVALQNRRVFRGLTSAAKKSRGLRNKGTGAEKLRPSKTASYKRRN